MHTFEMFRFLGITVTLVIEVECSVAGYEQGYITVMNWGAQGCRPKTLYHCDYVGQEDKATALKGALVIASQSL